MKYTFYCAGRLELMAYKKSFLIGGNYMKPKGN